MFPVWTWIVGFWLGAAIGSFLNVVIYRMPRGLSLSEPKNSFCPKCKKQLTPIELIPLLSWVFQGGKCKGCQSPIPFRYPLVELITGTLWAVIWYQHLIVSTNDLVAIQGADPIKAVGYMLFAAALVAAIFTDLALFVIPDQINAFMFLVGVGMNVAYIVNGNESAAWLWGIPSSLAGALVGIAVLWGIAFFGRLAFGKDAMGHGDIKMARGIGAVLLPMGAGISFGLAVILGALGGGVFYFYAKGREQKIEAAKAAGGKCEPGSAEAKSQEVEDEEPYEPESLGSLLKCLVGYVLLFDIIGLFFPKFYENYFGENPFDFEGIGDDEWEPGITTIPFGPSLAAGALATMIFWAPLSGMVNQYFDALKSP